MCAMMIGIAVGLTAMGDGPHAPLYPDKADLLHYLDETGGRQPVKTVSDWEQRRAHVLANMQLVMGPLPEDSARVAPDVQVVDEVDCGFFVRKRLTFAVESWDRLPAYLCVPKGIEGRVPAVLCLHPTYEHGKDVVVGVSGKPNRDYARELAQRGYVTLAPDYPGYGEYKECGQELYQRGYVSCTMKGIWNHMRCVDLLESLPEVDAGRIGCIGHSLGGHNTLFVGVFDPRVTVMVSSCGFNAFAKYYGGDLTGWSHDGYMPRIASVYGKDPAKVPFDFTEILGVLAPRPVFVNAPVNDANFDVSGVRDCIRAAKPVYALYGAEEKLVVAYPEAEHDFPDDMRERAYALIDEALRKKGV